MGDRQCPNEQNRGEWNGIKNIISGHVVADDNVAFFSIRNSLKHLLVLDCKLLGQY